MSFGSQSGRTRSSAKGFSSKEKKQKRRKQEFHTHRRWHDQESSRPDPEEVRARTVLALDRLGHQVISTEPGGYDLENWIKSLNSLLDDFQEKVGADHVTEEFLLRRREAVESLVARTRPPGIDPEMERLVSDEREASAALGEARRKAVARLASLKDERAKCERDLKVETQRLAELREAVKSRGLFSRLVRAAPSTLDAEAGVAKLDAELKRIDEEIERSHKGRASPGEGTDQGGDSELVAAQKRVEAARERLAEAQSAAQSSLQLAPERELVTRTISGAISSMKLGVAPSESGAG